MTQEQIRPGYEEILVEQNGRGMYNGTEEMLTNPPDAQDFLPKARFSKKQSAQFLRVLTQARFIETGQIDMLEVTWLASGFSIGEGGQGRKEAIQILTNKKPNNVMDRQREQGNKKLDG